LTLIVVDEGYRNKRIGQLLLDKFIEVSIERKMKKAKLEVRKNNLIAINLYKKKGFEFLKESSNGFIYMNKNL